MTRTHLKIFDREPRVLAKAFLFWALTISLTPTGFAAEFANIEYLCCDWGPAMKLPSKVGEKAQFDDGQEEVYFLKQVGRFTRGALGNQGQGVSVYLCKMKPDGSDKVQIKELWRDPSCAIDTQAQTTWMDVNAKTKKLVLSIVIGGDEIRGLWTMNLDGSELKRIQTPGMEAGGRTSFGHPSWTPDGKWIVFGKGVRGPQGLTGGLAKCDAQGSNTVYLTTSIDDTMPRVSPDGKEIAYIHHVGYASRLYLMNIDGTNQHPLPNPDDKRWGTHGGTYPAWSPDGKQIHGIGMGTIDAVTGRTLLDITPTVQGRPGTCGWAHWGRRGFVGFTVGGVLVTDDELREARWIGSSKLVECSRKADSCRW
jgi:hypothetical protein